VLNYANVGNVTSYTPTTSLAPNTTYYWQVRATFPGSIFAYADAGTSWSFTTQSGGFTKTAPINGATGVSLTPTLSWASAGALSYTVCIGTSAGNCNVLNYANVGNVTSYTLTTPLLPNTVYYWQVRATFPGPVFAYADGGTSWSFTTAP
jgi:hypothetical protein